MYEQHVRRELDWGGRSPETADLGVAFLDALGNSTATLYVMEPVGDTIRFRGLGRWPLPEVPDLLADPNGFIADRFGGGKYKINFHHAATFVCTHNFRVPGEALWRAMEELYFE